MNKLTASWSAVAAVAACAAAAPAFADNLLGLYAGVNIGESTVRSDNNYPYGGYGYGYGGSDGYYYDSRHHFAWKAEVGVRPIPFVGAEIEYLDFGHPGSDASYYYNNYNYGPDSHPRAIAAFGVAYLPVPFVDVYGKLGAARLHTTVNGFDGSTCFAGENYPQCGTLSTQDRWDTRFAYGVGVQSHFRSLGVRAEYERISSPYGDPDMFTVGVTWTF